MAGKKKSAMSKRDKVISQKGRRGPLIFVVIAIAAVALIALVALLGGSGRPKEPSAEERRYLGRYLPAGYAEEKLIEKAEYASPVEMARVEATASAKAISISVGDVIAKRNVYFEYKKPGGQALPLIAYIKPSGKLFVGISYCPPCRSTAQRIEPDGTLTCGSCGTKRDLETEAGISGACKLYPLDEMPVKVVGDRIEIAKSDLDKYSPQPLDRPVGG